MKIKINIRTIRFFIILFPFIFPLGMASIDGMTGIVQFLAVSRYVISIAVILYACQKKYRRFLLKPYIYLFIFAILFQIIALNKNQTITLTVALSCFSFIGFVLLNIILCKKNGNLLFYVYRNYLTLVLTSHVMMKLFHLSLNGVVDSNAVYLMGAKNGITPYVLLAFLSEVILLKDKKNIKLIPYTIFLTLVSIINASAAGIGAMILIDGYLAVVYLSDKIENVGKRIQKIYIITAALFVIVFFYFEVIGYRGTDSLTNIMTSLVGRDATFTGRRAIWSAALMYIRANPLWGLGLNVQYDVWNNNKYVYSAHNMFLDYAVKYGCISLALMIGSVVSILRRSIANRDYSSIRISTIATIGMLFASFFEAIEGIYATWAVIFLTCIVIDMYIEKQRK